MSLAPQEHPTATVLVVDDIAANRNVLSETLEKENYEVLLAPDGETALKVSSKARPDLLLLDVMMPGVDGFESVSGSRPTRPPSRSPSSLFPLRTKPGPWSDGWPGVEVFLSK